MQPQPPLLPGAASDSPHSSVLLLRPSVNRWVVGARVACLAGLLATSVSVSWWTLALGAALALSYRWSATRLSAAAAEADGRWRSRNPLRGKPPSSVGLWDLPEPELAALRAEALADAAAGDDDDGGAEDCETVRAFEPIRRGTACGFARRARLWGGPDWRPRLATPGANAAAAAPRLRLFCRVCDRLGLDGFVLRLPARRCRDFRRFAGAVYATLDALAACDAADCMQEGPAALHRNGWVFRFHGQTFFVTTFAPFYGPEDSRYACGAPDGFVLLQPEISFAQHDLPPDTPSTNWEPPASGAGGQTARDRVRCAFRDAGQAYRIRDSVTYPMIEDIVMTPKGQPDLAEVKWWLIGGERLRTGGDGDSSD